MKLLALVCFIALAAAQCQQAYDGICDPSANPACCNEAWSCLRFASSESCGGDTPTTFRCGIEGGTWSPQPATSTTTVITTEATTSTTEATTPTTEVTTPTTQATTPTTQATTPTTLPTTPTTEATTPTTEPTTPTTEATTSTTQSTTTQSTSLPPTAPPSTVLQIRYWSDNLCQDAQGLRTTTSGACIRNFAIEGRSNTYTLFGETQIQDREYPCLNCACEPSQVRFLGLCQCRNNTDAPAPFEFISVCRDGLVPTTPGSPTTSTTQATTPTTEATTPTTEATTPTTQATTPTTQATTPTTEATTPTTEATTPTTEATTLPVTTQDPNTCATVEVELGNFFFSPQQLTVRIGDTVRFRWIEGFHNVQQTVSAGSCDLANPSQFNSGAPTAVVNTTFDVLIDFAEGSYPYKCGPHCTQGMVGSLTVAGACTGGTTATTLATTSTTEATTPTTLPTTPTTEATTPTTEATTPTTLPTTPTTLPTTETTISTTEAPTTLPGGCPKPVETLLNRFQPPLSPTPGVCSTIRSNTNVQVVVWEGADESFASCQGSASFIMQGGDDRCYQELSRVTGASGEFNVLALTYASCNADSTNACMWTATYNVASGEENFLNLDSQCTTGGPSALPGATFNENGTLIPNQRQPDRSTNAFASQPTSVAPFAVGQCVTPTGPVNGLFRSYQIYCDSCDLPVEFAALPTFDNRTTIPVTTTQPASQTIELAFEPPIQTPNCVNVRVGDGDSSNTAQPFIAYFESRDDSTAASCGGTPSFLGIGDQDHCMAVVTTVGARAIQDQIFLSCNADNTAVCVYQTTFLITDPLQAQDLECTTGGANNFRGDPVFQQPPAFDGRNTFSTTAAAPFVPGTCYTPTRPSGAPFRSYQVFCSKEAMPAAYQSVEVAPGFFGPIFRK